MVSALSAFGSVLTTRAALAFFYCDYKDSETHYPSTILGSLAKQLVLQDERCYAELGEFCLDHTTTHGGVRVPTPEEVCELIRSISKHFQTTMIIVDGRKQHTYLFVSYFELPFRWRGQGFNSRLLLGACSF